MATIDFISLGCSKNLVDSEVLMGMFESNGYHVTHDSVNPHGEVVVVNTCGFIADAKEESINTILEQVVRKKQGQVKRIYVMGCLSERYLADLEKEIPEVDGWYGKFNYKELLFDLNKHLSSEDTVLVTNNGYSRHLTTPSHYAYIKISEGCDRRCAYCAIPYITGHHQSRPMEVVLDEVRELVSRGVKEFNVIAQELTYYGLDLYGEQKIAELIDRMSVIPGVRWIRLHYAYPTNFPLNLLKVMRERENVCKYLDIALQHISDNVLDKMHRHISSQETVDLINRIREEVPGIFLRTTMLVGFPGETDDDFQALEQFVISARFERMGAFAYSEEDGTYAATNYEDDVPEDVKKKRLKRLYDIQRDIDYDVAQRLMEHPQTVVIDRLEGDYYVGRTQYSSPEVDPEVLIDARESQLEIGEFYDVSLFDYEYFDHYGRVVSRHEWNN